MSLVESNNVIDCNVVDVYARSNAADCRIFFALHVDCRVILNHSIVLIEAVVSTFVRLECCSVFAGRPIGFLLSLASDAVFKFKRDCVGYGFVLSDIGTGKCVVVVDCN